MTKASRREHNERLERAKGIEPSYAAWEAAVLPLNYAREVRSTIAQPPAFCKRDNCKRDNNETTATLTKRRQVGARKCLESFSPCP